MKLLALRAERKAKKPRFIRQNAGHKKEVGTKYRKPRGYQSKLRLGKSPRGLVLPSQGYRSPKAVRGLNKDGLENVLVYTLSDISKIDSKTQCAIIGSSVGRKQKISLLKELVAKNVSTNCDAKAVLAELEAKFSAQKEKRKEVVSKRASKEEKAKLEEKKQTEKKAESVKEDSETKDDVSKQSNDDKKEKDKILTKKETAM